MSHSLLFYIDVSGQPYGEINVGLASIQVHELTPFLKILKRKYPKFFRHKQKGSTLRFNHIQGLVDFFNGQKIRMRCIRLKTPSWNPLREFLNNKQYSKEMVYAALYFVALKKYSIKGHIYPVVVCNENYLDIQKVKQYLKKLSKANGINYQISDAYVSQCEMLKVADLVAASGRKCSLKRDLDYYEVETVNITNLKYYLRKLKK